MPNPEAFLAHLREAGYHPRSNKHSNVLAGCIVDDLVDNCPSIAERGVAGRLVYDLNFTLLTGTAEWNVDLVLGAPAIGEPEPPPAGETVRRSRPSTVQIAIEIKAVMTEHRKAVKNRKRDFEAHHDHVHRYQRRAIAGGLLLVNGSPTFRSPLRSDTTLHRDPDDLVRHCVDQMRAVTERNDAAGTGLDAKGVVVLSFDPAHREAGEYLTARPAPPVGDPLHYDAFIQSICRQYADRF